MSNNEDILRIETTDPRMAQCVVHNGTVYISGQVDTEGTDVESQTQTILAKIDSILAKAGTNKSKLLSAQIWLKDIESGFQPMNSVWAQWLDPQNKPVRATVEAKLALPQLLVEIQVTAAL